MNTPPEDEALSLPGRFAKIKEGLLLGNEAAIMRSWERLLNQLREEAKAVTESGSNIIPTIDFKDLGVPARAESFLKGLKTKGAAVIRNVVSEDEAETWTGQLDEYLRYNPHTKASPPEHPKRYELLWSPAQLNARAHPNMLAVQKFLMSGCWNHASGSKSRASAKHPMTYADQIRIMCDCCCKPAGTSGSTISARVDGGSVERWEADSYGGHPKTGMYHKIWSGEWEDYDPWDSSIRLEVTSDLPNGDSAYSAFRMFQGILALNPTENPPMRMCALPLRLATAYWLLRPFFSPKRSLGGTKGQNTEIFLSPSNWTLDALQSPVIHGAKPSHSQDINAILHPHLQLDKTLIPLPRLRPGDFVIWHPDGIYADPYSCVHPPVPQSPCTPQNVNNLPSPSTFLYIPSCPLTPANALFLAHQRKAFILGFPGPDFTFPHLDQDVGESCHIGRPGVQEINEAGGEEALRAMGLLAWEEDDAAEEAERRLLEMANEILFPDQRNTR